MSAGQARAGEPPEPHPPHFAERQYPPHAAGRDAAGEWRAPFVLDLRRTLGVHARGRGDPAYRVAADNSIWRTSLTPDGPGTLLIRGATPRNPPIATPRRGQQAGRPG